MKKYLVGAAILGAAAFAASGQAAVDLGQFLNYGLLINNGVASGDINTDPVNANIGIGNITGSINLHNEVVNGMVDLSGSASSVSGGNITGTQSANLGGPSAASVNTNVSTVSQAITDALAVSTKYGNQAASGTALTLNSTTQTINASAGFLTSDGVRLFTASSLSIGNGHTITVNGSASDYVVIDVTGTSNNKLDGALALTGGITADHVIVNFTGTSGSLQGAANGAALNATFLAPNLAVTLNSLQLNGRIFGGRAGTNFQFVSNALIAQPDIADPTAVVSAAPEASTWFMMIVGFGALGLALRSCKMGKADQRPTSIGLSVSYS